MINLLLGRSGSGKSYEAVVHHLLKAIKSNRKVITNLPVEVEQIKAFYPDYVEDGLLDIRTRSLEPSCKNVFAHESDYVDSWQSENGQGALFIIDECHKCLRRGKTSIEVEEWYAEHRHGGHDVLLITQSYGKVSKEICDNIQVLIRVSNNRTMGHDKSYSRKVYDGVRGALMSTEIRAYDQSMFKFYKSHTQLSGSVVEAGANDIKPIWQHWSFIGAAICLVVFVLMIPSLKNPLKPPQLEITENELLQSENPVKTYPQVDQAKQKTPTAEAMEIRANAIAQERIKKIQTELDDYKRREESMPFHDVQLHIRGSVRGVRNGLKRQIYHISASQNGQHVFTLYDRELTQAGYELDPMGDCLLFITHSGITKELTCNAPTIQVTGT